MNILVETKSRNMISDLEGEPTYAEDKDKDVGHEGGEVCRLALLCTLWKHQFLDHDEDDNDDFGMDGNDDD